MVGRPRAMVLLCGVRSAMSLAFARALVERARPTHPHPHPGVRVLVHPPLPLAGGPIPPRSPRKVG